MRPSFANELRTIRLTSASNYDVNYLAFMPVLSRAPPTVARH
jgi:hypothetical protein